MIYVFVNVVSSHEKDDTLKEDIILAWRVQQY